MKLDYWTQISPDPISLSIGYLYKPTLREISKEGFDNFSIYEMLSKLTPESYFTKILNKGDDYWSNLSDEEKDSITLFSIISDDKKIQELYIKMLKFFFRKTVIYMDGFFAFFKDGIEPSNILSSEMIQGVISGENPEVFVQILELIQQVCGIYNQEEAIGEMKFKNSIARKLYEKMLKAKKEEEKNKKADKNMSLPNIISALSNCHPSLNYTNIWDLTVYQLLDSFNRIQVNSMYEIDSTRVSVWGDEKKTFDASLWYKNHYDK